VSPSSIGQLTTMSSTQTAAVVVTWVTPTRKIPGVDTLGYLGSSSVLVGLNDLLLGSLVQVSDPAGVYRKKHDALRRNRLSNEVDVMERRRGMRTRPWREGPWRVTWVSDDGSFGVTQDMDAEPDEFDLIVRADCVTPWNQ